MSAGGESIAPEGVYLRWCLAPFEPLLSRSDVTDIWVNRPGEIWIETLGGVAERLECAEISDAVLERLARQVAALSHQGVSREHPLLSASLPDGSRIQVAAPPATRGPLALAIRRHVSASLTLDDYDRAGGFADARSAPAETAADAAIGLLVRDGRFAEALRSAVLARKNIIVSGGTSTGKTTFLNALLREIPGNERLVLIEDTPELVCDHANCVKLLSVRGGLGEAQVSANDLVTASLRLRPDRIILGELRGIEAFAFLRAINSGHPGSMTTVHADSPQGAVEQLAMLVLEAGTALSRADVHHYVRQSTGLFVHLARTDGRRLVEAVIPARLLS